ncbi:MAG: TonB-dependent receptor, partial [Chitinophagaceae bacterium]
MKHKIIGLWLIAFQIISIAVSSQNKISGSVVDGVTKQPLVGASISYGNYKTFSTTEGRFSIPCSGNEKLVITYVGYKTVALDIANCVFPETIFLYPQETTLDSIEVTTTSSPYKKLLYHPASITKLNRMELNRGTGLFLDDAIQTNSTGVTMNRRSVSGGQQLNIRGYGNGARGTRGISSNFDGQGYKVYLNGIALTDAEGITVFDDIDFASLQNVEITKGPAGSLYGLAIAGAVNLTTIKPEKGKTSIAYSSLMGNYGLSRQTTTFQSAGEKSSLLINYGVQRSKGFMLHNASHKKFVNLVSEFTPNAKTVVSGYFGYSDSYDERAGELTITQYESDDYSGNPEYIKRNAHSHVNTFRAGIGYTHEWAKWLSNTTTGFGTAFNSDVSSAGGWTDKGSMNIGLRSVFNLKFALGKQVLLSGVTGAEWQKQIANTLGYNMKQNPKDTSSAWTLGINPYWVINAQTANVYTVANTNTWFSEWTLSLPKEFSFIAGVGSSRLGLSLNDRFNPELVTRPSTFEKTYGNMAAPHFSINKVIRKKISVFANYSIGFKAPVSSYFYIT